MAPNNGRRRQGNPQPQQDVNAYQRQADHFYGITTPLPNSPLPSRAMASSTDAQPLVLNNDGHINTPNSAPQSSIDPSSFHEAMSTFEPNLPIYPQYINESQPTINHVQDPAPTSPSFEPQFDALVPGPSEITNPEDGPNNGLPDMQRYFQNWDQLHSNDTIEVVDNEANDDDDGSGDEAADIGTSNSANPKTPSKKTEKKLKAPSTLISIIKNKVPKSTPANLVLPGIHQNLQDLEQKPSRKQKDLVGKGLSLIPVPLDKQRQFVASLFDGIVYIGDETEDRNAQAARSIQSGYYPSEWVERRCCHVLDNVIWAQSKIRNCEPHTDYPFEQYTTMEARLEVIIQVMKTSKAFCKSILDGDFVARAVDAPFTELQKKSENKLVNEKRDAQVRTGNRVFVNARQGKDIVLKDLLKEAAADLTRAPITNIEKYITETPRDKVKSSSTPKTGGSKKSGGRKRKASERELGDVLGGGEEQDSGRVTQQQRIGMAVPEGETAGISNWDVFFGGPEQSHATWPPRNPTTSFSAPNVVRGSQAQHQADPLLDVFAASFGQALAEPTIPHLHGHSGFDTHLSGAPTSATNPEAIKYDYKKTICRLLGVGPRFTNLSLRKLRFYARAYNAIFWVTKFKVREGFEGYVKNHIICFRDDETGKFTNERHFGMVDDFECYKDLATARGDMVGDKWLVGMDENGVYDLERDMMNSFSPQTEKEKAALGMVENIFGLYYETEEGFI